MRRGIARFVDPVLASEIQRRIEALPKDPAQLRSRLNEMVAAFSDADVELVAGFIVGFKASEEFSKKAPTP